MMKRLSADSPSRTIAWPGANVRCLAFAMTEARTFGDRTASNGMDAVLCGSMVPPGRRTAGIRQPRQVYPARQFQMGDSRGSQVGSVVEQRIEAWIRRSMKPAAEGARFELPSAMRDVWYPM